MSRDLNVSVAKGKNWKLPIFWAAILKYITAPILAIIFSFVYNTFAANRTALRITIRFGILQVDAVTFATVATNVVRIGVLMAIAFVLSADADGQDGSKDEDDKGGVNEKHDLGRGWDQFWSRKD